MTVSNIEITMGDAVSAFLPTVPAEGKELYQQELLKFSRWYTKERPLGKLMPSDVEDYATKLSKAGGDPGKRAEPIKAFFAFAKKKGWTQSNLSIHLRIRKAKTYSTKKMGNVIKETIPLTQQGFTDMEAELLVLQEERHVVIAEIRKAAADKDFRENAPLHAARERKGHLEGRIIMIESTLKAAVIVGGSEDSVQGSSRRVNVGDSIVLCEAGAKDDFCYTLVPPREADVTKGKISISSPMGQAVIGKEEGETVDVVAPAGRIRYQIKKINH